MPSIPIAKRFDLAPCGPAATRRGRDRATPPGPRASGVDEPPENVLAGRQLEELRKFRRNAIQIREADIRCMMPSLTCGPHWRSGACAFVLIGRPSASGWPGGLSECVCDLFLRPCSSITALLLPDQLGEGWQIAARDRLWSGCGDAALAGGLRLVLLRR